MDIKQLTEKLSKSSTSYQGKYVPWWSNRENDSMHRYNIFSKEEIEEAEAAIASAADDELTSPVCAYKYTPLHLLVWHNFYNAVKSIAERKLDIDLTDGGGKGVTPLMLACYRSNLEMVKLLLSAGADKSRTDSEGRTCWHFLSGTRTELVGDYYSRNASNPQVIEIADLLGDNFDALDSKGYSPLAYLVKSNDNETSSRLFPKLLDMGAKIDYKDENDNSLLLIAIKNNHNTVALSLAHEKSLVNEANSAGETPLQAAKDFRKEGLCIALKENGANGECEYTRLPLSELSRITSNAFAFDKENDCLAPAMFLMQKLINTIDSDDDDEIRHLANLLPDVLRKDESGAILDMVQKAGISLTEKYSSGGVWCLRDKCFSWRAGIGAIKKLVSMGIDINSAIADGKTPIHIIAAQSGPNCFGNEKCTYFEEAARLFDGESATVLDNSGVSAMHAAAYSGHAEMLKVMAELGADVNVTQDAPAQAGNTPLHSACERFQANAVKTLMELGADDSLKNVNGLTAAHIVANKKSYFGGNDRERMDKNRLKILETLKTLDEPNNDGITPLMLLQFENLNFLVAAQQILLSRGVDVNRKDSRGRTALILATDNHCYKDAVKELIRAGAELNAADQKGKTALHYALAYGSQDVARFLIKKGADYNRADNGGVTPVSLAAEKGYDTVLELMTDIK